MRACACTHVYVCCFYSYRSVVVIKTCYISTTLAFAPEKLLWIAVLLNTVKPACNQALRFKSWNKTSGTSNYFQWPKCCRLSVACVHIFSVKCQIVFFFVLYFDLLTILINPCFSFISIVINPKNKYILNMSFIYTCMSLIYVIVFLWKKINYNNITNW